MIEQAIEEILDYKPHWLYMDPTHLAFLTREMRKRGIGPPPVSAIILTYTMATGVARRQLEDFFPSVPMAQVVSMSEFGWLAMECEHKTLHLNNVSFHCELLRDDGTPVEEIGQSGVLHLTSIGDRILPHIRYETGDVYTLLSDCPCSNRFPAVQLEGRKRDMLTCGETRVSPKRVDAIVGTTPWLDVYKMEQQSADQFAFQFVPNDSYREGDERSLQTALMDELGPDARLCVEAVRYLPSERSGKFVSCTTSIPQGGV